MSTRLDFAKRVFRVAGVTGLMELLPLYFMERDLGRLVPPAITHPEFYSASSAWRSFASFSSL